MSGVVGRVILQLPAWDYGFLGMRRSKQMNLNTFSGRHQRSNQSNSNKTSRVFID